MRIGIRTHWFNRGLAYAAMPVKNLLQHLGHQVTIFPIERITDAYHLERLTPWTDSELARGLTFEDWLHSLDVYISFESIVPQHSVVIKRAACKKIHVIFTDWLFPSHWKYFPDYDELVCPTCYCHDLLTSRGYRSRFIPWKSEAPLKAPHPVGADKVRVLFNGGWLGFRARRNPVFVLSAMSEILRQHKNVEFLFKCQRREIPRNLPRNRRFRFLGKDMPRQQLLELYQEADLSLVPSCWEGFGLSILESLHYAVPVVTHNAPPMNEMVMDKVNGVLVKCRAGKRKKFREALWVETDRKDFQHRMNELLENPGMISRMKKRCHEGLQERMRLFDQQWKEVVRL